MSLKGTAMKRSHVVSTFDEEFAFCQKMNVDVEIPQILNFKLQNVALHFHHEVLRWGDIF